MAPLLSILVPVFNERESLAEFHARMTQALSSLGACEIIFVNDGSTDGSEKVLEDLAQSDPRIRVIHLSRNFGQQAALSAGIDHAEGAAAVCIDADLQDPPELIPEMLRRWREGHEIVFAQRTQRKGETFLKLWTARLFYKLMNRLANTRFPDNVGDFKLLDRKVVLSLRAMPERNRYMRGLIGWVGFRAATVPYARDARKAGASKYSFLKLSRLGLDGFACFSNAPLKLATGLGLLSAGAAVVLAVQGRPPLIIAVLFLGGAQLLTLGVLGEYVGRIFEEVKARPSYLISRKTGFHA